MLLIVDVIVIDVVDVVVLDCRLLWLIMIVVSVVGVGLFNVIYV